MVGRQAWAGKVELDAALASAIAGDRLLRSPGIGLWPHSPAMALAPTQHLAVDHDAAADPGAEDDAEHHGCAGAGAIDGFGEGEAVGVVGEAHFASERGLAGRA
ncbi:MAG: hypothetical protein V9G29_19335 [Burkholderiaceae bacterium]